MSKRKQSIPIDSMAITSKNKNIVIPCSTPEQYQLDSPSRDSDCYSDAASPVPFLCTQDGAEGETDVVWNYYTPKSELTAISRIKNSTPLSSKQKKTSKPKVTERSLPKRRVLRSTLKNTQFIEELIVLNQNIEQFINKDSAKRKDALNEINSGSDDDIFNTSNDFSPKSGLRTSSRCLRKNLLSAKLSKPDSDTALESDDSMNECLLKASQMVEENILGCAPITKQSCYKFGEGNISNGNINQNSMDAILNSIALESPAVKKARAFDSPHLENDSFDHFVGNLNDSALDQLTQVQTNNDTPKNPSRYNNTLKGSNVCESSPSSRLFNRHSSMPESPSLTDLSRPSTSGMFFGRYNSFPYKKDGQSLDDTSPIRCTPDEIKRKHQQAREKLLAKRLLPFTTSQQTQDTQKTIPKNQKSLQPKRIQFQPKAPSANIRPPIMTRVNSMPANIAQTVNSSEFIVSKSQANDSINVKNLIEKKRQEALMRLRKRQPHNKLL